MGAVERYYASVRAEQGSVLECDSAALDQTQLVGPRTAVPRWQGVPPAGQLVIPLSAPIHPVGSRHEGRSQPNEAVRDPQQPAVGHE